MDSDSSILEKAGHLINQREIERYRLETDSLETRVKTFNINEQIRKTDPRLWNFIKSITTTVGCERSGNEESLSSTKNIRRFNILCCLLYCTNMREPTPFQLLLSDTVEMCGGSRVLMKILNKLGVVTFTDTHDGFVTRIANAERNKTVWDELESDVFTVASADNFDLRQSNAAVYCGDQTRSYHATTIQLVQPDPHNKVNLSPEQSPIEARSIGECTRDMTTSELHTHEVSTDAPTRSYHHHSSMKRALANSPSNSPHKLGKVGPKRQRTLVPRSLQKQITDSVRVNSPAPSVSENTTATLCVEDFFETSEEGQERKALENKLYGYMFAKQMMPHPSDSTFTEFKDLYAITSNRASLSNIHYMELVDEHPDSTETMRYVSELLLHIYNTQQQNGYVELTGDGKTYEHLMGVKKLYGNALEKLLIFPGVH